MTPRWDVSIYDRNDQLVLVTEVKNKLDATAEWAGRLRRNIRAHGVYPDAPFFLMAFPDTFYLWTRSSIHPEHIEPDYTIDARPFLQPYFEHARIFADQVSGQSLELIITSWLNEVLHSGTPPYELPEAEQWLVESGLYAAIVGGRFEHEVVV